MVEATGAPLAGRKLRVAVIGGGPSVRAAARALLSASGAGPPCLGIFFAS